MENLPFTWADIIVVAVLLISALLAYARGAVREVLGIGAWIGAAVATFYGFPLVQPYLRDAIENDLIADAATGGSIFVLALIILTLITGAISSRVRGRGFGALNRTLGVAFGLLRGAVLISVAYMLLVWAVGEESEQPTWVSEAKTMPYVKQGADTLRRLVPPDLSKKLEKTAAEVERKTEGLLETERGVRKLTTPASRSVRLGEPAYRSDERKQLDSLIESMQE